MTRTQADQIKAASRLADYERVNAAEQRRKLVELWRKHHPEAAKETSSYLKPLMRLEQTPPVYAPEPNKPSEPSEVWCNDTYNVTVRRYRQDPVFRSNGGMIQLGISSLDGTARHDWRDFQAIKNQLAGDECEAFELYPAESRLLDPSNYYTLWCFPGLNHLRVGWLEREVYDAHEACAPQRAFPASLSANDEPPNPPAEAEGSANI